MGLHFPEFFPLERSTSFSGWQLHVAGGLEVPTQAILWFHDSIILLFVFDIGQEGLYWHFLKSMLVAVLKGLRHLFVFFFVATDFSSCFAWVHLFSFVCILPSVKKNQCSTSFLSDMCFSVHKIMPKTQVNIYAMTILQAERVSRSSNSVMHIPWLPCFFAMVPFAVPKTNLLQVQIWGEILVLLFLAVNSGVVNHRLRLLKTLSSWKLDAVEILLSFALPACF